LGKIMATDHDSRTDFVPGGAGSGSSNRSPTKEKTPQLSGTSEDLDIATLLGNLSDAIAVVAVVHRSLEALEVRAVGDEEVALRYALTLLRAAYSALDMASLHLSG
jgi:hypothetical protein